MLANKAQVGYMSVMPATILCSKPKQAEIKMVATLGMSKGTRCSLVVVRKDAPEFKSNEEVARWLDGKIIAAPKGSASDQYLRRFFEKYNVKPGEYLNQSIEVIATNFRIGKIDAASLWEPTLSRIATDVGEGTARIVADGSACDNPDLGILNMRADFVKNHRDVAKGYLRAELEAQRYMLDPANWENVINMVSKYATGIPKNVLWYSIYGLVPPTVPTPSANGRTSISATVKTPTSLKSRPSSSSPRSSAWKSSPTAPSTTRSPAKSSKEAGYAPASPDAALGVIKGCQGGRLPLQELTGPSGSVPRRSGTATKTVCGGPSPEGGVSAPAPQTGFSQS